MKYQNIIKLLKSKGDQKSVEAMARFGINPKKCFGLTVTAVRQIAREIPKDHKLAGQLWASGIREARLLSCLVEELDLVTEKQVDAWVKDFDSWDICDHCCGNLFDRTPFAYKKVREWSKRKEEFVKRAAFALLAWLAVHDKTVTDQQLYKFFPLIQKAATDERNYVKKAVSWALRHIGKRSKAANRQALIVAKEIKKLEAKSARFIANETIRELSSQKIQKRLEVKDAK